MRTKLFGNAIAAAALGRGLTGALRRRNRRVGGSAPSRDEAPGKYFRSDWRMLKVRSVQRDMRRPQRHVSWRTSRACPGMVSIRSTQGEKSKARAEI